MNFKFIKYFNVPPCCFSDESLAPSAGQPVKKKKKKNALVKCMPLLLKELPVSSKLTPGQLYILREIPHSTG